MERESLPGAVLRSGWLDMLPTIRVLTLRMDRQ